MTPEEYSELKQLKQSVLSQVRQAAEVYDVYGKKSVLDLNREIAEVEDWLEICRTCEKDKRFCRKCFVWQELHNKNY